MNKAEACIILDISLEADLEEAMEAHANKIFEIRQQFLRGEVVPQLARSRQRKVAAINDAFEAFQTLPRVHAPEAEEAAFTLENYQQGIASVKMQVASANGRALEGAIKQYVDFHIRYYNGLISIFKKIDTNGVEVKQTEVLDPMDFHRITSMPFEELSLEEQKLLIKELARCKLILSREASYCEKR